MYERATNSYRKVMELANQEALRLNQEYIGTDHLLLGLVLEESGTACKVLRKIGLGIDQVRHELEQWMRPGPGAPILKQLPQTPEAKKVIEYAIKEMRELGDEHVGTEHLLLGLLRQSEGVAFQVLTKCGVRFVDDRGASP
jgi:ATP-dependent Clp protease ATP-binding subunit ClpC